MELRLQWLDELPNAHKLCTALCLRQDLLCKEPAVTAALGNLTRMRTHSCVEEPGANEAGHEGVCAFRFLMDNYDRPWHGVYFTHGDVPGPKHGSQFRRMRAFITAASMRGLLPIISRASASSIPAMVELKR